MATKDYSSKQERMIAEYLDWKVVSGSGARDFHPGDIKSDRFLGECKTHMSEDAQIVFFKDVWDKILKEAMSQMKVPVLFVDNGTQKVSNTWCLFPISLVPTWRPDIFYDCQAEVFYPNINKWKNLHIDPAHCISILKNYKSPDSQCNYISIDWHKQRVGLLPLRQFRILLETIDNL